jgi:hypothetical protein
VTTLQSAQTDYATALGCSLHEVLTTIKAEVRNYPRLQLYHDDVHPIASHYSLTDQTSGYG